MTCPLAGAGPLDIDEVVGLIVSWLPPGCLRVVAEVARRWHSRVSGHLQSIRRPGPHLGHYRSEVVRYCCEHPGLRGWARGRFECLGESMGCLSQAHTYCGLKCGFLLSPREQLFMRVFKAAPAGNHRGIHYFEDIGGAITQIMLDSHHRSARVNRLPGA